VTKQNGVGSKLIEVEASVSSERLPRLRLAIRMSRVSFPSQVPVFAHQNRPEAQWRIAALYFVQGWSFAQLAKRYGVSCGRVRQALRKWVQRAAALGYLQRIPPEFSTDTGAKTFQATGSARSYGRSPLPAVAPYELAAGAGRRAGTNSGVDRLHKNP
jgi:hypothetical protein